MPNGKEAKDRILCLGEEALGEQQEWKEKQVSLAENSKHVFTSVSKQVAGISLDEQYLYDLVNG